MVRYLFFSDFFRISDFSDLVRLGPTYSDLFRLLHFSSDFFIRSRYFFNSEVDSELPTTFREINFKRVGGTFQRGMTMLMTISCKNQTKSVGTFPTCGTESRNKSEHFRLLGQKVGTFPTFETCWTNLLSSCPCLRSLAWRRLGRACTFGFASGRAGQDLHHELRRLRRRRSLRLQYLMGEVMRGAVLTARPPAVRHAPYQRRDMPPTPVHR